MSSTQVQLTESPTTHLLKRPLGRVSSLPRYSEDTSYELGPYTPRDARDSSLPRYDSIDENDASASTSTGPELLGGLQVTHAFLIETRGLPLGALPLPQRAGATPIYTVKQNGTFGGLAYESIKEKRWSGNCALFRPSNNSPVCSTFYRAGPNRPPRILLHGAGTGANGADEEFEVQSTGWCSRTQVIHTHLGTFQWSYASRKDRRQLDAFSVLLLDEVKVVEVAGGKTEERRRRVAQLVRKDEYCLGGNSLCAAGVGGRLIMDLHKWADTKQEMEELQILVISSCLVMLKKEIDRRRRNQSVMMM